MHYCFLSVGDWNGNGTLMRIRDLGAALVERGIQVSYIVDDFPYNRTSLHLHPLARVEYVLNPRRWSNLRARRKIVRLLKPDFVHMLTAAPKHCLTMFGISNLKVIGDWDEWAAIRPYTSWHRRMCDRLLDRWLRHRATRHIVASRYMQQQFAEHHGIQAAYIPHASFMPNYPDGQSPFSGPTFVYMGSFYEAYDHDILFQAARILSKRGIHPPMEIIGQGPDLEKWRTFIDQNGMHNLTLPGFMTGEDLWRHLRHAHTLLFPIRWSRTNACRCPGKTFMYMHAQRPVITCDVGEVTVQLGNLARYVPCTAEAFAEAIASAYKVPMPADVPYPISTWDQKAKQLLEVIGHEATEAASVPLRQTPAEPSALGMSRGDF